MFLQDGQRGIEDGTNTLATCMQERSFQGVAFDAFGFLRWRSAHGLLRVIIILMPIGSRRSTRVRADRRGIQIVFSRMIPLSVKDGEGRMQRHCVATGRL